MKKSITELIDKIKAQLAPLIRLVIVQTKRIKVPFFEGLSIYDVTYFFIKGLYEGAVTSRAGSISFSFFMALFPGLIFLFTLIPFVAGADMQQDIFDLLKTILPANSYEAAESTIVDIVSIKRTDLLWLTMVSTLIFATNGTLSLITNFSISFHKIEYKNFWQQYLSAILLTLGLIFLLIISLTLVSAGETFFNWVVEKGYMAETAAHIIQYGRTIVLLFTVLLGISLVYSYGPVKGRHWKLISPGSLLATSLIIVSSIAFSLYVTNFAQYNKLYGSIGTLLVIMLWIYINAIGLLLGFELNASIAGAKSKQEEQQDLMSKL